MQFALKLLVLTFHGIQVVAHLIDLCRCYVIHMDESLSVELIPRQSRLLLFVSVDCYNLPYNQLNRHGDMRGDVVVEL